MKSFADLIRGLDETNKTNAKIEALVRFFREADDRDKIWMLALFTGRKPRQTVTGRQLRNWSAEFSGIPGWLFSQCYGVVGDLAETISLLLPAPAAPIQKDLYEWIKEVRDMAQMDDHLKRRKVEQAWNSLPTEERFAFHKLITGAMRLGVSQNLVVRALAKTYDLDKTVVAHRLTGQWHPDDMDFHRLVIEPRSEDQLSKPYPFFLAHQLDGEPADLGAPEEWHAEWKWDGIRGQLIHREGQIFIWSRGEELVTDAYPELATLAGRIPDGIVLDGELLAYKDGSPLPFQVLQQRIGRKRVSTAQMRKAPVVMMVYDILEADQKDIRSEHLETRKKLLSDIFSKNSASSLVLSGRLEFDSWKSLAEKRKQSRTRGTEGIMLKRCSSPYRTGRQRGDWWKWKVDPYSVDAVLIYAQSGSGRRAGLFTDYTFGVWDNGELVPFTKAYSGLTDAEIREVDNWIRRNSTTRFGPVRVVQPFYVFEIGFEGIARSVRHKAGVALRFPRMLRWRKDKKAEEADTLDNLKLLLRDDGAKENLPGTGLLFPE